MKAVINDGYWSTKYVQSGKICKLIKLENYLKRLRKPVGK